MESIQSSPGAAHGSGANRTGLQMSPLDSAALLETVRPTVPPLLSERDDQELRADCSRQSGPLGSVPPPVTLKGALTAGLDALAGRRPQVLVDKLGERLAFERSGVRLYEGLLAKHRAQQGTLASEDLAALTSHHRQEREHFALCADALSELGADPTAMSPGADLAGVAGSGLHQAMHDPRTTWPQALQIMLDAERIDHGGWQLLVSLTRECGHETWAQRFELALAQESQHLTHLQGLVARLTLQS